MQNQIHFVLNEVNNRCLKIVEKFQTITFQAEVLSGDKLIITATTDECYKNEFYLELSGVSYISGHLVWHWDNEYSNLAVETVANKNHDLILQKNCFLIKFNNVDIGIKNLIIMAKTLILKQQ